MCTVEPAVPSLDRMLSAPHGAVQAVVWTLTGVLSLLIVASRKHYSVDVVVAWYAVPLVFWMMHRRWTTKRPPTDEWPHRPLIAQETELAEVLVQQADVVRLPRALHATPPCARPGARLACMYHSHS